MPLQNFGNLPVPRARDAGSRANSGALLTIPHLLGSSSTITLVSGTHSNLTLVSGAVSAAVAIVTGQTQTAVIREARGSLALEYPVTFTGAASAPASSPTPTPSATPNAPALTRTSVQGANPVTIDIGFDDTVHIWEDGYSGDGSYDFVQLRRADNSSYTNAVSDLVRLTPILVSVLGDSSESAAAASAFPNTLVNMPAGVTYLSARVRRGAVPGRVVHLGDSITFDQSNWINTFAQAHPEFEVLRNAYSGRSIDNTLDGNGILQHIGEVQNVAPAVVAGLIGANDLPNMTASQYQDKLTTLWAAIRTAMPYTRIVWCTILPVSESKLGGAYAGFNAKRATVNTWMRGKVGTLIDAVCDFAADSTIGVDAAAGNTSLWKADGLHPDSGAQSYLNAVSAPVILAQLAAAQTWTDSVWSTNLVDTISSAPVVAVTKWDPNRKSQYAVLSNNDRSVAGTTGVGANTPVMGTTSRNAGKLWFEIYITGGNGAAGLANANFDPINANKFDSGGGSGNTIYTDGLYITKKDGSTIQTSSDYRSTGFACDFTARTVGIYKLDVVAGTKTLEGTIDMPAGPLFPFGGSSRGDIIITLNTGQDAFTAKPSDFTAWS